jgi:hypothetical protein
VLCYSFDAMLAFNDLLLFDAEFIRYVLQNWWNNEPYTSAWLQEGRIKWIGAGTVGLGSDLACWRETVVVTEASATHFMTKHHHKVALFGL